MSKRVEADCSPGGGRTATTKKTNFEKVEETDGAGAEVEQYIH
jgi:hypothetical protein